MVTDRASHKYLGSSDGHRLLIHPGIYYIVCDVCFDRNCESLCRKSTKQNTALIWIIRSSRVLSVSVSSTPEPPAAAAAASKYG